MASDAPGAMTFEPSDSIRKILRRQLELPNVRHVCVIGQKFDFHLKDVFWNLRVLLFRCLSSLTLEVMICLRDMFTN